jgi:hypothetical protein
MPPFDLAFASKALMGFTLDYLTIGTRYPGDRDVPDSVVADFGRKTDDAIKAGLMCLGEIARIRTLMDKQRQTHLPMPSAAQMANGYPSAVLCQACSMDGAPVAWPCGVWKLADSFLADGANRR